MKKAYVTPDGRYFLSKGRLWRCTNPNLPDDQRKAWIKKLMKARLAVRDAADEPSLRDARMRVDDAKRALGERGPVWWTDGAPDEGGRHPKNSSYAAWWHALPEEARQRGEGSGRA